MKPDELIVGDYVRCETMSYPSSYRNYIVWQLPSKSDNSLNSLVLIKDPENDGKGYMEFFTVEAGVIEPIPLTPDILHDNGWRFNNAWHSREDLDFVVVEHIHSFGIAPAEGLEIHEICMIKFVHELQHLLRLCGVEKEIVL